MGIFLWIIFGALVGWIASAIMGTGYGMIVDIVIGIIGAVIGGWLMSLFGSGGVSGFNLYSFFVAILGSIVFIVVARALH